MMDFLNKPSLSLMERSLDASALRQRVIANNVANVDTPQFKRSDVLFEELLQNEITGSVKPLEGYRTDPRHFKIGQPSLPEGAQISTDEHTAMNNNGNNVDMDYEMALMVKNQLKYNTLVQQMNADFKKLRTVMEGRR